MRCQRSARTHVASVYRTAADTMYASAVPLLGIWGASWCEAHHTTAPSAIREIRTCNSAKRLFIVLDVVRNAPLTCPWQVPGRFLRREYGGEASKAGGSHRPARAITVARSRAVSK